MPKGAPEGDRYSFDEFKIYYDSTEKVTDRRLATNTWNYGLCTGVMIAVSALGSWASSHPEFRLILLLAILVLSGMGTLLCVLWTGQIRDFKELNAAKFDVLNMMAPSLSFGDNSPIVSATPFAREWEILKARQATREVGAIQIVALRSSNAEFLVPFAFRWLFILIMVITLAVVALNWPLLKSTTFAFGPVTTGAESKGSGQK